MSQEDTATQGQEPADGGSTADGGTAAADAATELQRAEEEARKAREAADAAKTAAETDKSALAEERAKLASERAEFAEQRARAAERAKNDDGSKTYDEAYVKKLRDEAAGHRVKANEALQKVQQLEDAAKSDAERATDRIAAAERTAEQAQHSLDQIQAAIATKLPLDLAPRLVGTTLDELKKDAEKLARAVKPTGGHGLDQGQRGGAPDPEKPGDMNTWLRKRAGVA